MALATTLSAEIDDRRSVEDVRLMIRVAAIRAGADVEGHVDCSFKCPDCVFLRTFDFPSERSSPVAQWIERRRVRARACGGTM